MSKQKFFRSSHVPIELRYSSASHACYKKHTHDEFSIGVVDSGVSEYFNQNNIHLIRAGTTVIVNPNEVHSCNPKKGTSWSYKMLYVCPKWLAHVQGMVLNESNHEFIPFQQNHTNSTVVFQQFQNLVDILIQDNSKLAVEEASITFFSNLFSFINTRNLDFEVSKPKLLNAYHYISDNCHKALSIKDIAEYSYISEFHLIHSFRKEFGITPHAVQLVMRVNLAKSLLKEGQSIASIATDLGFVDQSHFYRNFKKIVAATPLEYKNG
ncbi:AraC family transcriptional regulator [Vibrio rumoiensis]|uniref:AraC family transcriptional regulator n=1 Tax=Vibrio rumoiensis 1S-45 TaxID=1188252 RepID=A0A1E5E4H9_9VIBR|nr:AraC family transcriptional regulator [Vibrio rumoiensis]OEF27738.1 AraC family transcriptional regulator [Vibrio rumoiensis 1S-45]